MNRSPVVGEVLWMVGHHDHEPQRVRVLAVGGGSVTVESLLGPRFRGVWPSQLHTNEIDALQVSVERAEKMFDSACAMQAYMESVVDGLKARLAQAKDQP